MEIRILRCRGGQVGRLLHTAFLVDYWRNPDFRREILRVFNREESVNSLKPAIYSGKVAGHQARRTDDLQAVAEALNLLTNIVMAWHTAQMQATVDRWANRRQVIPHELMGRIAPTSIENINLRGESSAFPSIVSHRSCCRRSQCQFRRLAAEIGLATTRPRARITGKQDFSTQQGVAPRPTPMFPSESITGPPSQIALELRGPRQVIVRLVRRAKSKARSQDVCAGRHEAALSPSQLSQK